MRSFTLALRLPEEGAMRDIHQSSLGRWTDDGSRFEYDPAKVAEHAGYTVDEVKLYGVVYCLRFRRVLHVRSDLK